MIRYANQIFRISVRQLVEFVLSSGDLDNRRGTRREQAMLEGTRIHKKIQQEMGSDYRPEVAMKLDIPVHVFNGEEPDYVIALEGRADGLMECGDGKLLVDEIKGMYVDVDKLKEPIEVHEAQAKCYGYIQTLEDKRDVCIQLTYVDMDTEKVRRFKNIYSHEELSVWFEGVLEEYKKWTTFYFLHRGARNKTAMQLEFPYPYREGQKDLVAAAYRTLKQEKTLFIQASTGIGKTLSTLFPAIRVMGEERAEKVFYLTAKTITRSVAKEAVGILSDSGLAVSSMEITAKEKLCFMDEMDCNPESCPYAKGHMDRVNAAVYELITTKEKISREDILEVARRHEVCPFEMSLDVSYWVDVVICDYNYVFDPNVRLQRFFSEGAKSDAIFLVDEAHNLVERAREMISATVKKEDFLSVKKTVGDVYRPMATRLESCNREMLKLKRRCDGFTVFTEADISPLTASLERLYEEYARFAERFPHFYNKEFSALFFAVRDYILVAEDLSCYKIYGQFLGDGSFIVKLLNVDPSRHLEKCIDMGRGSVFFSATLLPINYYKRLLGGKTDDYAIYAKSPFDVRRRLIIVGSDISTKYTRRTEDEFRKAAAYIREIVGARRGNYIVFCPSYAYMDRVFNAFNDEKFRILKQSSAMSEADREEFLDNFSEEGEESLVGLCVMGGIFSEGIDLRGERLIGVIILGTGLPQIGDERDLLRSYFEESNLDGFAYAYMYPGINKVLQAAGRLIRTDEDRGVIALLDERFLRGELRRLFPREWETFTEVTVGDVRECVSQFWNNNLD
ncbi:MAG: ATP-dependent DNA helicase [Lachnospiraceae bacterium]|nr:ATP-dependent DNA helicase [Lachnospiraceae bacterium]